jgi:hypothetical protein
MAATVTRKPRPSSTLRERSHATTFLNIDQTLKILP